MSVWLIGFLKFRRIKNHVELFGLLMEEAVFGIEVFVVNLINCYLFDELNLGVVGFWFFVFLAILTGSPDFSLLATDVETGTQVARVDDAHGWVPFGLKLVIVWIIMFWWMVIEIMLCFRAAVNRLVNLTETTIASGDDDGCVKVHFSFHLLCKKFLSGSTRGAYYIFYFIIFQSEVHLHMHHALVILVDMKERGSNIKWL